MSSKSIFPFNYFYKRIYPTRRKKDYEFSNVTEYEINKIKIYNIDEYINCELDIQERIFRSMNCDEEIIKKTIEQMRYAYNSKN